MRFSLATFLVFFSLKCWSCLFEIENANLDTTCSPDVTSYELDTYYALKPPQLRLNPQEEFDRVRIGRRLYGLPAAIKIFERTSKRNEKVNIEFLKGSKLFRKVEIRKLPEDFPEMEVRGEGSSGFFLLAPMRVDGRRSFALILDNKGRIIFFRAYDKPVNNFRKQGAYFTISLIERMIPVAAMGTHIIYADPLSELHRIRGSGVETRWGFFAADVHDLIYFNQSHYIYLKTYPEDDLFWGCIYSTEIIEYRNGVEKLIFSSRSYLSYEDFRIVRWSVLNPLNMCKSYFYLNSIQDLGRRMFLLSSRAINGVHLWSDQTPIKGWDLGARFGLPSPGLTVLDWVGHHTPHFSHETSQIILFDNGQAANLSSLAYSANPSSLVLIDLDSLMNPIRSKRLSVLGAYQASSMGSSYWYDRDTVIIGAGYSFGERPFDVAEMKLKSQTVVFKARFKDPHVMNYRVYKVLRLD